MYRIAEIFYSLQGEGRRVGEPSVFIRFAGCNLQCTRGTAGFDCDTDHKQRYELKVKEIADRCTTLSVRCRWVVFTGGEPSLQADPALVEALHCKGYKVAVETNGTRQLCKNLDWITVSPKRGTELVVHSADEVKHVISYGDPLPREQINAKHRYLSPAFQGNNMDTNALKWCVKLTEENPRWTLTVQMHKLLKIP
jgi:organic radical activating enzyme